MSLGLEHTATAPSGPDYESHDFSRFPSRRSVVYSPRGIIASPQPIASQAGLSILKAGGNALDAAIATAAGLCVTEPMSTGVGGDMFLLYWSAAERKVHALNASGRAPAALTIEKCRELGINGKVIPGDNVNAVTVPGQVGGWIDAFEKLGSGKVTLAQILEPAVEAAEKGYAVSAIAARQWVECEEVLKTASPNGGELLRPDGKAPRTGQLFKNPFLGKVLREIGEKGRKGYYEGWVAEAIVEVIKSLGGVLSLEDLKNHTSTWEQPLPMEYKDITLWECPPNGQGIVALEALGILKQLERSGKISSLEKLGHNSLDYAHAVVEALRYAFADANEYVADPSKANVPIQTILSEQYLSERTSAFSTQTADSTLRNGVPTHTSDTVYFTTSDHAGNACSFICSNASNFGGGAVPKGCGFALQNRGHGFILREGHLNSLQPGKRPYHTIMPAMVTKKKEKGSAELELEMAYGVMGGFMQPQGHLQVLLNTVLFGMHAQDALDAPRICIRPARARADYATNEDHDALNKRSIVCLEEGFGEEVVEGLKKKGHEVEVITGWGRSIFGRGQIIKRLVDVYGVGADGKEEEVWVWEAGSDLRGDGHAVPA